MARTVSKTIKAIPVSETGVRMTCFTKSNESGDKYIITHNPLKEQYTLWKSVEEGVERVSASNNPLELNKKIPYEM